MVELVALAVAGVVIEVLEAKELVEPPAEDKEVDLVAVVVAGLAPKADEGLEELEKVELVFTAEVVAFNEDKAEGLAAVALLTDVRACVFENAAAVEDPLLRIDDVAGFVVCRLGLLYKDAVPDKVPFVSLFKVEAVAGVLTVLSNFLSLLLFEFVNAITTMPYIRCNKRKYFAWYKTSLLFIFFIIR
jgi:hypothetical protein